MAFANEADLAYAAGIIDGEGCIAPMRAKVAVGKYSYYVRVSVIMKEEDIPLWLFLSFGGGKYGTRHCKTSTAMHRWDIHGTKAAVFLEAILPYLKLKKQKAELAIKLARYARNKGRGRGVGNGRGSFPVSEQDLAERESLAIQMRKANAESNASVKSTAKWGMN